MKTTLALTTVLCAVASTAHADITLMSWGGVYEKSQVEAYNKPFTAATGINVTMTSADNPSAPIKSMVDSGNVTVDVVDLEYIDAVRLCDEGLLEEIDLADLPPAPDGTPATDDFVPRSLTDCAVSSTVISTVYAFNDTAFPDKKPSAVADFFDLEAFPGKRGLRKDPKGNLEMALMGDGVPAAEVYAMLETPEGVDRAFKVLDKIKSQIVWWEAGAQPAQLLADGEVALSTIYNGRAFSAVVSEGKPFTTVWDGQIQYFELFAIPMGAPNKDQALEYIKFATGTQPLADQAKYIPYGPARKSSLPLVGMFEDGKTPMLEHMPTAEVNMANALSSSSEFWADRSDEIAERFSMWLMR